MKNLIALFFAMFTITALAQIAPDKYYVQFTDKDGSPYSINNPQEYLSQRAIDRRQAHGIAIDEYDLPVNPQYLEGVTAAGAEILNPTKWLNGVTIHTDDPSVVDAINDLPYVLNVRSVVSKGGANLTKEFFENEIYTGSAPVNSLKSTESRSFDFGEGLTQISMVNGDAFHEMGYRGQGMLIAVLDAGFFNTDDHPAFDSLWANGQIAGTRDFVKGGEVTYDTHPHGTMVLSCIGANYPGELIGTAPMASFWLLRTEDGASEYIIEEYNWVSGAEFADSAGVDVINSSLGYSEFNDPSQNHTYEDMDGNTTPITNGADLAASRGILVVNSLGNSGNSSWKYLIAPSDGDSVMGVGAVDGSGNIAGFSSYGPSYDGRVKPNLAAMGSGIYAADPYGGGFTYSGGTSFSSPIMAGIGAILWQANPDMSNMEIISALEQSSDRFLNPDDRYGHGIPDVMLANNILTVLEERPAWGGNISIYPNPASQFVMIDIRTEETNINSTIRVSDMTGKRLMEEVGLTGQVINIPLEKLSPGVYFISVYADELLLKTEKVIKR
jgi:hypothetical protein